MTAIEEQLLRQRSSLLGFIQSRLHDPDLAEDVLQEGLLRAIRAAGSLQDDEKLLPWFYRILNNAIIDTYRRRGVEARYLEQYARSEALELSAQDEAELCACFRDLLPALKPSYRQVLDALDLSGRSPEEVAGQMNLSRGALKVRRHRARQALRQKLEETCRTCAAHGCLDCTCASSR